MMLSVRRKRVWRRQTIWRFWSTVRNISVLVTLDEHFANWAVARLTEHAGVIRLKVHPTGSRNIEKTLLPFLERYAQRDFRSVLAILRSTGVRWIHTA